MGKNKIENQKPTTDTTNRTHTNGGAPQKERDFLLMVFLFVYILFISTLFLTLSLSRTLNHSLYGSRSAAKTALLFCRTDTLCQCLVIRIFSIGYFSRARLFVRSWLSWTRCRSLIFGSTVFVSLHMCKRSFVFILLAHAYACLCIGLRMIVCCLCLSVCELDIRGWVNYFFLQLLAIRSNSCYCCCWRFFFASNAFCRTVQCSVIIIVHATKHGRLKSSQN